MNRASNRIAIVTGAARGIGAATVRRLCSENYHVVAVDACLGDTQNQPEGVTYQLATRADLEELVGTNPDRITPVICDVRDANRLRVVAEATVEEHGRIDAVVASAAVMVGGSSLWDTPSSELKTLLDIDVIGVWNTAAACIPFMLTGPTPQDCRFVAIASAASERGLFHLAGYCTAKHAVVGLVRGLAADLVGTGVTAVVVSPGATDTSMLKATAAIYGLERVEDLSARQLVRRTLSPQEVAATIAFCCSTEAAALNGSVVSATGGYVG